MLFWIIYGAEKIIRDFFLHPEQLQYLLLSKNAIAYAVSAGKPELAFSLAEAAIKLNKQDPG